MNSPDRRDQILSSMHRELDARVRVTRVARVAGVFAFAAVAVFGLRAMKPTAMVPAPRIVAAMPSEVGTPIASEQAGATEPRRVASRARVTVIEGSSVSPEIYVDDSQLEDLLREAGRPLGIIRVGGTNPRVIAACELSPE